MVRLRLSLSVGVGVGVGVSVRISAGPGERISKNTEYQSTQEPVITLIRVVMDTKAK